MAESIEIGFVGKITYYTIVVYLLFILGLIIVCRHHYKSRQERKSNKASKKSVSTSAENSDDNKDMGLFQSKKKRGYRVNEDSSVTKRNAAKQASRDSGRPMSSGSKNGEAPVADHGHRNFATVSGDSNKNVQNSTQLTDSQSADKYEEKSEVCTSTDCSKGQTDYPPNRADNETQEIAGNRLISANENKVTSSAEAKKIPHSPEEASSRERMGRQTAQKSVNDKGICSETPSSMKEDPECGSGSLESSKVGSAVDEGSLRLSAGELSANEDNKVNLFADEVLSSVLNDAYHDLENCLSEITNLAESVMESSMKDVLSHVNDQKVLQDFASDLSAKILNVLSENKAAIVRAQQKVKKPKHPSKASPIRKSPAKHSSVDASPNKVSSCGKIIKGFSEELSSSILQCALEDPGISSCQDQSFSVRLKEQIKKSSPSPKSNSQESVNYQVIQKQVLNHLCDELAETILQNCLDDIDANPKAIDVNLDETPEKQIGVNLSQSGEEFTASSNRTVGNTDIDKGPTCEIPKVDLNEVKDESGNVSIDSDVNENEEKSPRPVMLRNKNLLKVKLHTDRPLSGYAEQLASFLADDDESLDLFESDEEFDAVLGKMEEKYKGDQKINSKIQRRRRTSDSKKKDIYTTSQMSGELTNSDRENSNDDLLGMEGRNRIDSSQSDSSFLSDTDTDELLKGSFSDDQILSPGFSKFNMKSTAVIDTGCGILKAGLAGEVAPRCMLPAVIGVPRRFSQDLSQIGRGYYVGEEAIGRAGMLQLDHPIKQNVTNWADVNSILEYLIEVELGINIREHPLLLTETGLTSRKQREKLTEIMFERHGVPAFFLANQGPLSLYSMGLMSGLCLNAGFAATQAIPVYEGHALDYCTQQLDVGGHQISNHLGRLLLSGKGLAFSTSSEKFILNIIKERIGYVAEDPKLEQEKLKKFPDEVRQIFTLPDGQELEIDVERFRASEILFDPEELGLQQKPIHSMIMDSIAIADNGLQSTLTKNVVVTGGTSLLPGFIKRLKNELNTLTDYTTSVRLSSASNPITATWTGGSVISSRSTFSQQCVTTDQYAEIGASVVHMKCF